MNRCTNTFLSVFGLRAGTQLNFRGLHFSSNVPKFWFTTTSGMRRVDHLCWNSLERNNQTQTIIHSTRTVLPEILKTPGMEPLSQCFLSDVLEKGVQTA